MFGVIKTKSELYETFRLFFENDPVGDYHIHRNPRTEYLLSEWYKAGLIGHYKETTMPIGIDRVKQTKSRMNIFEFSLSELGRDLLRFKEL